MEKSPPRFVNLQGSNVSVFNQKRRNVTVIPFHLKDTHAGTFVCEGEHYGQFVAPRGPLSEYPKTDTTGFKPDQVVRDDAAAAAFAAAPTAKGSPKSDSPALPTSPPAAKPAIEPAPTTPAQTKPDTESEAKKSTPAAEEEMEISLDDLRKMSKADLVKFAKANGVDSSGTAQKVFTRLRDKFFPEE